MSPLLRVATLLLAVGLAVGCGKSDDDDKKPPVDDTCEPTTCLAEGAECGSISDGCGGDLTCGSCSGDDTCGTDNTCACEPTTTCAAENAECGTVPDGCGADLSCGTCSGTDTCDTDNQCVCEPATCVDLGAACGMVDDGCGTTLDCGVCSGTYFLGDFITDGTYQVGYYAPTVSASALTLTDLDGTDINAIAVSPSGTWLVASGHSTAGTSDYLYAYDLTNLGTPVTLLDTTAAGFVVDINEIVFSPNGLNVAFLADTDSNNEDAVYVVPLSGATAPKRVSPIPPSNGDAKSIVWVDDTTLAYLGDVVTDGIDGLWSVDVTAGTPAPVDLVPSGSLTATQDVVTSYLGVDNSGRVYFKADIEVDNLYRLYRVDTDGTNLEQVPGTAVQLGGAEASVAGWGLSPDGTLLAMGHEATDQIGQVNVMDVDVPSSIVAVTAFTGTVPSGGAFHTSFDRITWSPDQTLIGFAGDWPINVGDLDDQNAFFVASASGSSTVRITKPAVADIAYNAYYGMFSSDGSRVFIVGDLVSDGESDLFATEDFTTPDQAAGTLQAVACPEAGDIFALALEP